MASFENIVECIEKPPNQRTDREILEILPWFLNKAGQVFGKLKTEVSKDILRNCEHSARPRDNIIIRQGDTGDCFYVLLSGKVSIFINTEAVPDDPEEAQVLLDTDDKEGSEEKKELDRSKYGKYIVSFESGRSFGEIALLNKDCVRNASIIADELCHLVVINRDLYNRSIRSVQEAEMKEKQDFINNCDVFHGWMARYKRQAMMSLRKEVFSFDSYIVKQGEPLDGLYFVLKGQAKVVVDIIQHYTQYPQLHLSDNPDELMHREVLGKLMEQNIDDKSEAHKQKLWEKPLRRQGYVAAEQRQSQRHLELSLVGKGEMIGDVEHGMDLNTYAQSIICVQDTEVFILDAKNYERLVMNKRNMSSTLELLGQKAETKLMSRVSRALDKQVPLIRTLCHRIIEAHRVEEQKRRKAEQEVHVSTEIRNADTSHFIPTRGPIIDPFGPGTVFYRNKLKRDQKLAAKQAKQKKTTGGGGGLLIAAPVALLVSNEQEAPVEEKQVEEDIVDDFFFTKKKVVEDFQDFETSSEHLSDLERRMQNWFQDVEKTKKGHYQAEVVQLSRFRKQRNLPPAKNISMDQKIHPGKKVYIRPKRNTVRIFTADYDNEEDLHLQGGAINPDDEIFITAQAEIRSRLSSRQNSAGHTLAASRDLNDEGFDNNQNHEGEDRAKEELYSGRISRPKKSPKTPRDSTADIQVNPSGQMIASYPNSSSHSAKRAARSPVRSLSGKTWLTASKSRQSQSALPSVDAAAALSRVSTSLPAAAKDDPIGYSVQTHGSRAEQRANTAAIIKDILNNRLVPEDVKATLADLQKIHQSLPNLDDTKQSKNSHKNANVPMFRARNILLPGKSAVGCNRCRRHHIRAMSLA